MYNNYKNLELNNQETVTLGNHIIPNSYWLYTNLPGIFCKGLKCG